MRYLLILAALWAAACGGEPNAAPIEAAPTEATAWTSDDGVVSVTIPAGWASTDDASADQGRLLTVASPTQFQAQSFRQCSVERRLDPTLTQATIDAAYEAATELSVAGPPAFDNEVHSFSKETINGVRVMSLDRSTGDFRQLQTNFAIRRADAAFRYTIACGAVGGENADLDIAAMQQFISSLAINAGTTP